MHSRRDFLKSALGTVTTLMLVEAVSQAAAQQADLTSSQMRESGANAKLTVQLLRDNVSMISGSGGNILVLPGPDGKLVMESGFATSKVHIIEALNSISSEPLKFLINTHWHFDHTDGNEWMHAAGATIIAQERTLLRMTHRQVIPEFEGVYPPSPHGALPTITFDDVSNLEVNRHKISMVRYTPAHTDTDISVHLLDADVMHTGDSFFSRFYPFIDYNTGGSIDGMIAACRQTLVRSGPSTILVCGHGPVGGRSDLLAFINMMVEVRSRVAKLKASGLTSQETIARKPTASYDQAWTGGFISPALFISLVYRGV